MSALRLIFNGDDYGRADASNEAVMRAYEQGVLTSASLMVTGDAVPAAVAYARAHPALAIGLHLAMTATRSILSPSQAPHLLDAMGRLPCDPARAGIACFFAPAVRRELHREIEAQFERFHDTGLVLSHVDSHHLMHLHPTVFPMVLELAEKYGAHGIRLPRDDLWRTLAFDRSRAAGKASWAAIYALLCRLASLRLASSPIAVTGRVYGLLQSVCMHEAFVVRLVRHIPQAIGSAELYLHPSVRTYDGPYGPNSGDLATLLSPRVRQAINERGAQLTTYPALRSSSQRRVVCPGH